MSPEWGEERIKENEQRIRELNEIIAQVGWSMRETSDRIREVGYEINEQLDPQYHVAVFVW